MWITTTAVVMAMLYAANAGLGPLTLADIFTTLLIISAGILIWVATRAKHHMDSQSEERYRHKIERFEKVWVLVAIIAIIILNVALVGYTPQIVTGNVLKQLGVSNLQTQCPYAPPGQYATVCNSVIQQDIKELLPLQNEGKIKIVVVYAGQWYWDFYTVAPNGTLIPAKNLTLPTGVPIVFLLVSVDVNHDFGLYSPAGTLEFQEQVSPDYVAVFVYEFTHPGPYIVRCLEYCGPGHWTMMAEIYVD